MESDKWPHSEKFKSADQLRVSELGGIAEPASRRWQGEPG